MRCLKPMTLRLAGGDMVGSRYDEQVMSSENCISSDKVNNPPLSLTASLPSERSARPALPQMAFDQATSTGTFILCTPAPADPAQTSATSPNGQSPRTSMDSASPTSAMATTTPFGSESRTRLPEPRLTSAQVRRPTAALDRSGVSETCHAHGTSARHRSHRPNSSRAGYPHPMSPRTRRLVHPVENLGISGNKHLRPHRSEYQYPPTLYVPLG